MKWLALMAGLALSTGVPDAGASPSDATWLQLDLPVGCAIDHELRTRLTRVRHAGTFSSVSVQVRNAEAPFDVQLETTREERRYFEKARANTCAEVVEWVVYTFELLQDEQKVRVHVVEHRREIEQPKTFRSTPESAEIVDMGGQQGPSKGLLFSTGVEASSANPAAVGLGASLAVGAEVDHLRVFVMGTRFEPERFTMSDGSVAPLTWHQSDVRASACWMQTSGVWAARFGACLEAGWRWVSVESSLLATGVRSEDSYGTVGASFPAAWVLPLGFAIEGVPAVLLSPAPASIETASATSDFQPPAVELTLGMRLSWKSN